MKNYNRGFVGVVITIIVAVVIIGLIYLIATGDYTDKTKNEITTAAQVQKDLVNSVPIPKITSSSERANVAKRAEIFNNEDKISYIYLVNYGKVMSFFSVKGKVSSLRSYMTPEQRLVRGNGEKCDSYSSPNCFVVDAPDIDGTYGENVEGIFFFTTEGAYVEWKGDYMMSDQPLKLTTQPELVRQVN